MVGGPYYISCKEQVFSQHCEQLSACLNFSPTCYIFLKESLKKFWAFTEDYPKYPRIFCGNT